MENWSWLNGYLPGEILGVDFVVNEHWDVRQNEANCREQPCEELANKVEHSCYLCVLGFYRFIDCFTIYYY